MTTRRAGRVGATHRCPGLCGREVPRHHFACRFCWYLLPPDLRRPISAAYRVDPDAHLAAMADATRWYRENQPEVKQ